MTNYPLIPVILCGGVGSRLWPVSRVQHPKPFIKLSDGHSLLQKAFIHGSSLENIDSILIVTNGDLLFKIQDEFEVVNDKQIHIDYILEPFGNNTAAALACAALEIKSKFGPNALMLVLPADHLIGDYDAFKTVVTKAVTLAQQQKLVTFGIKPTAPETGFGYIETQGNQVIRFIEKPTYEKAQLFVNSGNFLWNSGMFCFSAQTLLTEMAIYCPKLLNSTIKCIETSNNLSKESSRHLSLDPNTFAKVPDISIDYAVMEKSKNIAVVPCDIGWNDIGSWKSMSKLIPHDENGNVVEGSVVTHQVTNCYIRSASRLVGAVGIDNLIIIDTEDALLVVNKDSDQDVKILFNQLKEINHPAHLLHQTVHRPWGTYSVLEDSNSFKIKRIVVKPEQSLSLQMHHHRSEHWVVVSGTAKVTNGDKEFLVTTNESTYIPAGHQHRLSNPGVIDLVLIEVQSGEYLGEDDIIRFEDVYGRCTN